MNDSPASEGIVQAIMSLPLFQAEWVLWFLIALSIVSVAVMIERARFYTRRRVDIEALRRDFSVALGKQNYDRAAEVLQGHDTLETNVTLFALQQHAAGPDAVEDLVMGVTTKERERYDEWLIFLATVASNAPFIGLFGTVLGIIKAFKDLSDGSAVASTAVMAGVSEALVATAVGLLVAIPAVVAFNVFKKKVKLSLNNAQLLCRILLAHLKSVA